jgi:hypothetical protein
MKVELYDVEGGKGFRIVSDIDVVLHDQPFDPDEPGFAPMTNERAADLAALELASRIAYVPPVEEKPKADKERIKELEDENATLKARLDSLEPRLADTELALVELFGSTSI